jgi:O-antigen ligase
VELRWRQWHGSPDLIWAALGLGLAALLAVIYAWSAYAIAPWILPALAIGAAFVALAFAYPWVGLAGAMLAIPLELFALPLPTGSLSPAEGALALAGLAYLVRLIVRPHTVRRPGVRDLPFLVLLGAITIGIGVAVDPAPVVRTLFLWTLFYGVFLQAQTLSSEQIRNVVVAAVIGAGILGAIGAIQFAQSGGAGLYGGGAGAEGRVAGTFASGDDQSATNYFASALQLIALPAIALITAGPRKYGWLAPLALLIVVGLMISLSRGGTLGFVAGLLVLVALWGRARLLVGGVALLAIVLTIVGANPLLGSEQVETITQRLSSATETEESSTNLRPKAYAVAIDIALENPLTGIGVNQFRAELGSRGESLSERGQPLEGAHNVFLSLASETGLFGIGAFLFFIGVLASRARVALRSRDGLAKPLALGFAATLIGFAVQGLTVTQNRNHLLWGTFLLIAGMLVALSDQAEEELFSADRTPRR